MPTIKQESMARVQHAMKIACHVVVTEQVLSESPDKARASIELARLILEEDDRQVNGRRIITP